MADLVDAVVAAAADALAAAVDGDFNDAAPAGAAGGVSADENGGSTLKKRALELLAGAADEATVTGDDLELQATTLDDVMVSPVLKKARTDEGDDGDEPLAAGDAESVDDKEQQQQEKEQENVEEAGDVDLGDLADDDADALAPPDASTDDEQEPRRNGNGKVLDVVTLDDADEDEEEVDEEEEEDEDVRVEDGDDEDEDDDEGDEGHLLSPMQRRKIEQNKNEARQLLHQLDSSARSKLVLTALEKYGEVLFEGHEAARDGILVDACANDAMLGLLKEAIRVSELSMRGTEDAPLEVDDDEDYGEDEEEDEVDDEDDDDEEETADTGKRVRHQDYEDEDDEDTPGEINLLSDEETDDNSSAPATAGLQHAADDDDGEEDDEEEEEEDDDDDDADAAGTGGELTVESATGDEDSLDELSS